MSRQPTSVELAAARVAAVHDGKPDQVVGSLSQRVPHRVRKAGQHADLSEIGTYGLRQYGGFVAEEWLRQLQGSRRAWAYREMIDNDPVIGAFLYAIEMLARGVPFTVNPGEKDNGDAEFVETCMDDMSHTWDDFISEALSMLGYGWSFHEIVLKRRLGPNPPSIVLADGTVVKQAASKHTDGRIGWRKLPGRAQETLQRWGFDEEDDGLRAMEQIDYQGRHNIIPIEKALLFRTSTKRGNPEGRSILRNSVIPCWRKKNIEEIEAIGIERDLAGLPVMKAPENFDIFAKANQEILAAVQALVTSIRRDESEGVVLPTGWELELLSSGGSRQISPDVAIRRYEQRIAASVLADFILIGQDSVGSFAMVDVKADLFGVSVDTVLDMICEVINRYAIPRLLALNGMDVTDPPQVTHGSVGRINLERVGTFLNQITLAGAPIPWSKELLEALFAEAGLPANFDAMQEATPGELVEKPGTAQPVSCPSCDAVMSAQQAQSGTCPTCGQPVQPPQPPGREPPPEPLSKAEVSNGAMVALYPPAATAERLSQDGGEPADELHLTLAFLGPAGAITSPDELRQAVALWAARTPPLEGQVSGTGKFTAGPVPVSYASADVPGLPEARQRLVENLQRAGTPPSSAHGFTPHITLAYDRREPQIENHPLSFDRATLKIGDERHDFPLAGIRKADAHTKPTPDGQHVINVAPVLQQRARLLEHAYAHDVKRALGQLGETAQRAYLTVVQKADSADVAGASMAQRVIDRLGLGEWFQKVLQPVLKSHTQRVMQDTLNTLKTQIGLSVNIPDFEARQILANGGTKLGLIDVEQQVRDAIVQAITEGRSQGLGPEAIARRIREYVPAGRFTNAGSAYRSKLIARTETLNAQRLSTLAAYRAAPNVTAVELRDGLLASSDATCEARDGDIVNFDAAASLAQDEHPLGTLSFNPVVVSAVDVLPE